MKKFSVVLLLVVATIQPNSGHSKKDHSKHHHKKHQENNEDNNIKIPNIETVNLNGNIDPSPINPTNLSPPPKDSVTHVAHRFYLNKPLVNTINLKIPQSNPGKDNPPPNHPVNRQPKDEHSQQPHHIHLNKPKKDPAPHITCVDESNRPVDWIIFYKLPRVHGSPNAHIVNGEAYMYVSSEDVKRFEESKKKTSSRKDAESFEELKKQGSSERDSSKSRCNVFQKNISEKNNKSSNEEYEETRKFQLTNNIVQEELWKEAEPKTEKLDSKDKHMWTYYPFSFFNTNYNVNSDLPKDDLDTKHEYTYYAYDSNNYDPNNNNDGDKSFLGNLKDALIKLFAKDVRDQISVERGDIDKMDLQDKARLLKSELAVGNGKRRFVRDTNQKNTNLLNDLLKTHILKDSKDASNVQNMINHIGKKISPNELSEIMQAFELLNNEGKNKHKVDTDGLDGEMDTNNDGSQSGNIATGVSDDDLEELDKTRYEIVKETSSEEYEVTNHIRDDVNDVESTNQDDILKVATEAEASSIEEETPTSETSSIKDKLQWTLSSYSVRDPQSLPGKILSPFLFNASYAPAFSQDGIKILYNDQTPNKTTVKFGHSKGLVLGNSDGGVWIVHSVPHFVDDAQASYTYPHTGLMYGQNFLCLSLNRSELDSVAHNLGHNQVFEYSTHISDNNRALYPTLARIVDGTYATAGDNYFTGIVHTRFHEVPFRTFAKTRELGEDLYKVVGRDLNASLVVESWPNGPGRLPTDCQTPGRLVENVEAINATGVVAFRSTHDHAKWTISFGTEVGKNKIHFDERKRTVPDESEFDREAILEEILRNKGLHSIHISLDEDSASHVSSETVEESSYPVENIEETLSQVRDSDENTGKLDKTENSDIYDVEDLENFTLNLKYRTNVQDYTENPQELSGNSKELIKNDQSSDKTNGGGFFVCNGDINRAEDQLKRGGGTVCMDNEAVWGLYHSLIGQVEPCPRG